MKIKKSFSSIITALCAISTSIFSVGNVFADTSSDICSNANVDPDILAASGCGTSGISTLPDVIVNILNAIILVSGLVAVIFIIIGGIQYMTSTGEPSKTKKAKDTILYACIGLVICVLAFAIVNWVIGTF